MLPKFNRISVALGLLLTTATASVALADENFSFGAEYETAEGVIAFTRGKKGVITTKRPEFMTNERFLCTTEKSPILDDWPLVSFTHDMGWKSINARTLEIVLGPTRDGDTTSAPKQSAVITKVYKFLHSQRAASCDETVAPGYCFVSVAAVKTAVPEVTDRGCGGDYLAHEPKKYKDTLAGFVVAKDNYSKSDRSVWTQVTMGIKKAALITASAEKLFSKANAGPAGHYNKTAQQTLFAAVQTAVAGRTETAEKKSLILYAAYSVLTYLRNGITITESVRAGDGFHAPVWKNAFVLYPKTSVMAVVQELSADAAITADSVWTTISAVATPASPTEDNPAVTQADFKSLWNALKDGSEEDPMDQAKPGSNTTTLLLEVRYPTTKHFTVTNAGNKDTMTITVPSFTY